MRTGPLMSAAVGRALIGSMIVPGALASVLVYQAHLFQQNTSATYDEPLYLRLGLQVYREGSFQGFVKPMTPTLPILLAYWPCAFAAPAADVPPEKTPRLHAIARRTNTWLVGVPLVILVYGWLTARRGVVAGAAGGALMALSPNVVAHAAIAATDACFTLFALIGVAAVLHYRRRSTWPSLFLAGAAVGTALAAKQSAVFLFPLFLVALVQTERKSGAILSWGRFGRLAGRMAALTAVAFFVSWAWYGFAAAPLLEPGKGEEILRHALGDGPGISSLAHIFERLPVPASVNTLVGQLGHSVGGHEGFLLGMRSDKGWWYYFPVAVALKATPADFALILLGVVLCCRRSTWDDSTACWWALASGMFFAFCLASRLNLGVRYLSVLYPLLILFAIDGLGRSLALRPTVFASIALLLVAAQTASAALIAPHYLSYFNVFAGGPADGYRYLVDSNLDWGQDLPSLKRRLDALGSRRPVLAYFGETPPEAYGIHATLWDRGDDQAIAQADCFALSATYLQGVGVRGDPFARFRELAVTERAAYSIFVYDLSRPGERAALATARATNSVWGH